MLNMRRGIGCPGRECHTFSFFLQPLGTTPRFDTHINKMHDEATRAKLVLTMCPEATQVQPPLCNQLKMGALDPSRDRMRDQKSKVIDSHTARFRFSHAAVINASN